MQGVPPNSNTCQLCGAAEETVTHLFLDCPFLLRVWRSGPWPLDLSALGLQSMVDWIKLLLNPITAHNVNPDDEHAFVVYAVIVMDSLWFARNQKVHHNTSADPNVIFQSIQRCYK
ncbi:hypothetical protein CJ030_MR2G016681 [Morella rubra]|uniref:Reverse transcriptase zinc-binding domain-containing protein n=1 Tax=Morella rubra TaxID=262757 RepID=A0A6A1WEQ8_9ROSI|nr:hypothetical protein CJ030_MR2G016681 [Morella rubra]